MADKVTDMVADNKEIKKMILPIGINMEIQFGERVGHGGWLIRPKLFRTKAYPACVSSKLCKFVLEFSRWTSPTSVWGHFKIVVFQLCFRCSSDML